MIDLHAAATSNGMRARIALEECELPYKLHMVDLAGGGNKSAAFLALNPNGQIPVMIDSEGPGGKPVTVSQSMAILMYCAEKSGKFIPKDPALRPLFLQGLMSAASDIGPTLGAIFGMVRAPEQHRPSLEPFENRWKTYLKVWDGVLARSKYCVGDEVSVVDLAMYGSWVRAMGVIPALCAGNPNLERWAAVMAARPAIQRALKF